MHATVGALSALQRRTATGEGQVVDASIYESVLAMMESLVTEWADLLYLLARSGISTDVPVEAHRVASTGTWISEQLGLPQAPAMLGRAGWFPAS